MLFAETIVPAQHLLIEHGEGVPALLLAPSNGALLLLVVGPLVVREDLRIEQAAAEVAIEHGVDPVHCGIDLGAPLQALGIFQAIKTRGEEFQDR